eukprot:7787031-Lingulodinium_polyedra.AAC.1
MLPPGLQRRAGTQCRGAARPPVRRRARPARAWRRAGGRQRPAARPRARPSARTAASWRTR